MLNTNKLKDETSKFISSILVSALEGCRQGNAELAEHLGLSNETMKKLDDLKADQIANVSCSYMRNINTFEIFQLDPEKISKFIELAVEEKKEYDMIDEYLSRGACKSMMYELFGWRSTHVAARKKFLGIKTPKGRHKTSTLSEQEKIYDAWLTSIKIADYRERLLFVARRTDLTLAKIYKEVQEIEDIQNAATISTNQKMQVCA